jgi:putative ABC transport system permease protein
MNTVLQDLRYGLRLLAKSPGFTAVAVLTLALGIGANTAIFSVVDASFLARLPYSQPDRLLMVWENNSSHGSVRNTVSPGNFLYWQENNTVFEQLAGFWDMRVNLTGNGSPEQIPAQAVTPNLFPMLGVGAALGRPFMAEEGQPGKDNVVLLSYGLWQRRFGGDPDVIGRKIALDGQVLTMVGVMPRGFQLFVRENSLTGESAELWEPIAFRPADRIPAGRFMMSIGRLKPGVSLAQARSQLNSLAANLATQYPAFDTGWGTTLVPLRDQFVNEIRQALLVLLGAVGLVLLIACANVADLLLGHASARSREVAIRASLGASRWRTARQFLTEGLLLAAIGGAAGVLLANWGTALLLALSPKGLLDAQNVRLDFRVLAATMALTVLTGILFGLAPALAATRTSPGESLKGGDRQFGGSARANRVRNFLVEAEIALALVLLTGAGLLVKSFLRLQASPLGFDPRNLLTVKVDLSGPTYAMDAARTVFFGELIARVKSLPGVESASANSFLPLTGSGAATEFNIEGRPAPRPGDEPTTDVRVIEPDYFRTMRIPLLRGRLFTAREAAEESHVVIISDAMARQFFPAEDPIGKRVTIDMKEKNVPSEIVGVVGDIKLDGFASGPRAVAYWPHPELPVSSMSLVVRSASDPSQLAGSIRAMALSLDPDQPISDARTMDAWMADSLAQARFNTLLLGIFSGAALLLAVVGIYGVMAYSVTQRAHEMGIRMAVGAEPRDIFRLVVGQGMRLVLAGAALGLVASLMLTRLLASLLFGTAPTDPLTFAAVVLLLMGVALAACYIPARRAMRVDPVVPLRYE